MLRVARVLSFLTLGLTEHPPEVNCGGWKDRFNGWEAADGTVRRTGCNERTDMLDDGNGVSGCTRRCRHNEASDCSRCSSSAHVPAGSHVLIRARRRTDV